MSSVITQGQMSMEPSNDYNNLHGTLTRQVPLNGEFSLTASAADMHQNDTLIPPTNCTGTFGIATNGTFNIGPTNPFLFPCSQWNTTAALSQPTANMLITTTLLQESLVLQPTKTLTVRTGLKYYREDYRNNYLAYNPENGDYGYVIENGAQGGIIPGPGIWNPVTYPVADDIQVRNIPYSWRTIDAFGGADWKFSPHDTAGVTYTFDHYDPAHRERDYVDDNSIKLNLTDKTFKWATLRLTYTYLRQTGSVYDSDPYAFAFFYNLPGFVPADDTVTAWTVDAMRKYDVSDRRENKLDLMLTLMPRDDMTVSASVRGDWNQYPTEIGRQGYDSSAATLQWEWRIQPTTTLNAWIGLDHSSVHLANVNDAATDTPMRPWEAPPIRSPIDGGRTTSSATSRADSPRRISSVG